MNARGWGGVVVRVGFALICSRSPLASLLNYETIQYQTKTDTETKRLSPYCFRQTSRSIAQIMNHQKFRPVRVLNFFVVLHMQFNDNQLDSWEDLDQFKNCTKLQTIYLERNPIWRDTAYRRKVKLALPTVTQIDATLCG